MCRSTRGCPHTRRCAGSCSDVVPCFVSSGSTAPKGAPRVQRLAVTAQCRTSSPSPHLGNDSSVIQRCVCKQCTKSRHVPASWTAVSVRNYVHLLALSPLPLFSLLLIRATYNHSSHFIRQEGGENSDIPDSVFSPREKNIGLSP